MKRFFQMILFANLMLFLFAFRCAAAEDFDGYIVKLKDDAFVTYSADLEEVHAEENLYKVSEKEDAEPFLPFAEYIEPNYTFTLDEFPTYDYSPYEKIVHLQSSNSLYMQDAGVYGAGVKIGIIDSGIFAHSAIAENLKGGKNYVYTGTDEELINDYSDEYGHGTSVAGVAAAAYGFETIGAAPKCELYSLKCFNGKTTSLEYIVKAIYGGVNDFNVDILNMSFGSTKNSEALKEAIDYADANGVLIIASAGNSSDTQINYPAVYDNVIGVGALDEYGLNRAYYSCYNTHVFCTAVGSGINTLSLSDNSYTKKSGTSFSCPLVSGIVADMLCIKPDLTIDELKEIIIATSTDLGDEGYDTSFGYGKIDAKAIFKYMLKDKEFYISQADSYLCSDSSKFVEYRIWRNPNSSKTPVLFWNRYDSSGLLTNLSMTNLTFENEFEIIINSTLTSDEIKGFIWTDTTEICPVAYLAHIKGDLVYDKPDNSIDDMGDI